MPNNKDLYHLHLHKDSSIVTLVDFINDGASIGNGLNIVDLVNYEDEVGEKNIEKIFWLYTSKEKEKYKSKKDSQNESDLQTLPLKIGTELALPLVKINRELQKLDTNQVVDFRTFKQFIASQLYYLLKEPKYEQTYKIKSINTINTIRDVFPFISVWVWSRALSITDGSYKEDVIINITPFITSINTTVANQGGAFNLSLPPLTTQYVKEQGWELIKENIKIFEGGFVSENGFYKSQKEENIRRSDYYFHNIIQENDVVWIRFEKLDIEENRETVERLFQIPKQELKDNIYDMIGLVDSNSIATNPASASININISGRDLVKLFIEDGVYFYPFDFTSQSIFANEDIGDRLERYDGQLKSRFQFGFKTIDNTLKFIMNALSNIKITSDDLFDSYANSFDIADKTNKDRRSEKFVIERSQLVKKQEQIEKQNNEVKEIKDLIKQSIDYERINSKPNIESVYSNMFNFLETGKKQNKIIETGNELSGWGSDFVFNSEEIKQNRLPSILSGRLVKDKRVWRDSKGNVINDQDRKDFIDKVEKQLKKITEKLDDVLLGKNLDKDNNQKQKDAWIKKHANEAWKEFYLNELESETQKAVATDAIPNKVAAATKGSLINENQLNQKIQYELLQGEYDKLKQQAKEIKAIVLPINFDELNQYAKEAFTRIWRLMKVIETYNNTPEKTEKKYMKGIWQIIKLVIDDNIRDRRIVDSSIGNEHGSLINGLRKIAQEPFVELLFDTYGDQFYITVRKPPFDRNGMIQMIEDQNILVDRIYVGSYNEEDAANDNVYLNEENKNKSGNELLDIYQKQSIVLDIEDSDIINDNLNYGLTNQIYSWYRLTPQNLVSGQANDMAFAYLKAIYLKEYADIWGSKPLDISTNYIPYFPVVDKNSKLPTGYFIKQGILDLKFMIESNAYNPFIRYGNIVLAGNRKYKRGTFVRLKSTNEIFYVDAVVNDYSITDRSIQRTTTLQLSHGMVKDYIEGVYINNKRYSYFDIVKTHIDDDKFMSQNTGYDSFDKILANWKVDTQVFSFFVNKKQFAEKWQVEAIDNKIERDEE